MKSPLITEIQRFSLQDGPGIRTTVFVKGCPLKCPWCHNPETQKITNEYYYYPDRCLHCGRCAQICPTGASKLVKAVNGKPRLELDRSLCRGCMQCVAQCPGGARAVVGQDLSLDQVLKEVLSDKPFYNNSGGGVTISGGEPLLFPEFILELTQRLRKASVQVAIETSCFANWKLIEPLLESVDLFIVDLKSLDAVKHREVVGWPLEPVVENLRRLIACGANVRVHLPIIPGFNDSADDFAAYVAFLRRYSDRLVGVDVLNYHSYAEGKYTFLGRGDTYEFKGVEEHPPGVVMPLARALKETGIASVTVGGMVGITTGKSRPTKFVA